MKVGFLVQPQGWWPRGCQPWESREKTETPFQNHEAYKLVHEKGRTAMSRPLQNYESHKNGDPWGKEVENLLRLRLIL